MGLSVSGSVYKILTKSAAERGFSFGSACAEKVMEPDFVYVGVTAYYRSTVSQIVAQQVVMNPMLASADPRIPEPPDYSIFTGFSGYYRSILDPTQWSCPFACAFTAPFTVPDGGNIYVQNFSGTASGLIKDGNDPIKFKFWGSVDGLDPADPTNFPGTFTGPEPVIIGVDRINWDEEAEEGEAIISFTYAGPEEPTGFNVEQSPDGINWNPSDVVAFNGGTDYTTVNHFFSKPDEYWIRITPYDLDPAGNSLGDPSEPFLLTIPEDPAPIINIESSGEIVFGGAGTVVFLANPAGIYTLVPDKRHDTIYNRDTDPITALDITIPKPFIKTGFLS